MSEVADMSYLQTTLGGGPVCWGLVFLTATSVVMFVILLWKKASLPMLFLVAAVPALFGSVMVCFLIGEMLVAMNSPGLFCVPVEVFLREFRMILAFHTGLTGALGMMAVLVVGRRSIHGRMSPGPA